MHQFFLPIAVVDLEGMVREFIRLREAERVWERERQVSVFLRSEK